MLQFTDRTSAGRDLAALLTDYRDNPDVLVLGLPRGGVPVAFEVARSLHAPLDVIVVRKLGAPGQPELALGAIASGGATVLNPEGFDWSSDPKAIERIAAIERTELERRERLYRANRPPLVAKERIVIIVDDGAATGASMLAAVHAVRRLGAKRIVVALPVASRSAMHALYKEADVVLSVNTPLSFLAVGEWYQEFSQTSDAEVIRLLARAEEFVPERSAIA